jgi:hypothetical protein
MPPRKTNRGIRKNTNRRTTWSKSKSTGTTRSSRMSDTTYACNSPKFTPVKNECKWRIGSYRNVYSQFASGSKTQFSPTTANRWIKYVNNGNRIYKFNTTDFSKFFGTQIASSSPTVAKNFLKKKFGASVKDVTRGKGNCWLVATTKNVTARPFNSYNWK